MSACAEPLQASEGPLGGQCSRFGGKRGGCMSAAQNRFKQARAPSGGSAAVLAANVGAI